MNHPKSRVGSYRILRKIADGGMGQVFLARRASLAGFQKDCVVKTIRPDLAGNRRFLDLFLKEARISALLSHQNIVQIFDADRDRDGVLFLAMEYMDGPDLRAILDRLRESENRMPLPIALGIVREALQGLDYAHRRADENAQPLGIVHRDLTPNNVLLSGEGEVKIADFGVAKTMLDDPATASELKGKFHYLAPEQIEKGKADARTDLYSLGVVLYEMIAGVKPFNATGVASLFKEILQGRYAPLKDVPSEVGDFVSRALARDPDERFSSAAEMLTAIDSFSTQVSLASAREIRAYCRQIFGENGFVRDASSMNGSEDDATRTGILAGVVQGARNSFAKRDPRGKGKYLITAAALSIFAILVLISFFSHRHPLEDSAVDGIPIRATLITPGPAPRTESDTPPAIERAVAGEGGIHSPIEKVRTNRVTEVHETPATKPADSGFLSVGDLIPFAQVYIDDKYYDDTPTKLIPLPPGHYRLRFYNPQTSRKADVDVTIQEKQTTSLAAWP